MMLMYCIDYGLLEVVCGFFIGVEKMLFFVSRCIVFDMDVLFEIFSIVI